MGNNNHALGRWGEEAAANYLSQRGYSILSRNFRTPHGEIDLVTCKGEQIVFFEVKARTSLVLGYPEDCVDRKKQAHMFSAAEYYLETHAECDMWQYDVIAIIKYTDRPADFCHFENVLV